MGEIYIPSSVYSEITSYKVSVPSDFIIIQLDKSEIVEAEKIVLLGNLHTGEAEAIILTKKINADFLLTDDASARLYAEIKTIPVHGSLGIVLWNLLHKKIDRIEAITFLHSIKKTSLWVSEKVFQRALSILSEIV
jgi:predicted nucleic acid-binding protein